MLLDPATQQICINAVVLRNGCYRDAALLAVRDKVGFELRIVSSAPPWRVRLKNV